MISDTGRNWYKPDSTVLAKAYQLTGNKLEPPIVCESDHSHVTTLFGYTTENKECLTSYEKDERILQYGMLSAQDPHEQGKHE
ncbi:hypothetical protein J6590_014920 [Homalodisca vitripennis]|nr:hypothetical protein J6590_014920 [Homalodisca vitripennis]